MGRNCTKQDRPPGRGSLADPTLIEFEKREVNFIQHKISVVSQRCRKWRFFSRKRLIPLGTVFGTPSKSRPADNARMFCRINDFQSFTTQTLGHYCHLIIIE